MMDSSSICPEPVRFLAFLAFLVSGAAGCGESAPPVKGGSAPPVKTFPVNGKVSFKNNSFPVDRLDGGKIWFQSTSDPNLKILGGIDSEGTFMMTTIFPEKGWPGVPAGQYKVRVDPPLGADRKLDPNLIQPKYQDFKKSGFTITVPVSGEICFEVDRP